MKLTDAQYLNEEYLKETFLVGGKMVCAHDLGYRFEFMKSKNTLGQCNYSRKVVRLSESYVLNNSEELVTDTILHELAHVFDYHVYGNRGHGYTWKSVCREVGAKPQRCKGKDDGLVSPKGKWVLRHKDTKEVYRDYHRKPSAAIRHCKNNVIWIRSDPSTKGKLEIVSSCLDDSSNVRF